MVEGCNSGFIRFTREPVLSTPLTVEYYLQGTATNERTTPPSATLPTDCCQNDHHPCWRRLCGTTREPDRHGAAEPTEYIRVILGNPYCTNNHFYSLQFNIVDTLIADVSPGNTTICQGGSVQFNTTGGASYAWSPATGLSCTHCPNPIATPATTTIYSVVITEELLTDDQPPSAGEQPLRSPARSPSHFAQEIRMGRRTSPCPVVLDLTPTRGRVRMASPQAPRTW